MADSNIKEALESVVGYIGEEVNTKLETKQDVFRVSEMDEATSSNVGNIVQYIGTSIPDSFQHNYFYECKAQGTEPETYAWEQVNVQPSSEGDARVKPEITEIGVRIQDGYRPYIKVDAKTIIPTFENATWEDIALVADLYYNGDVSLEDIQEKWEVGDSKTISLSATDNTAAQDVTVKIVDFAHDDLTDADTEVTKALLTLGFELSENIAIGASASGWQNSTGRIFCNENVYNALPSDIKSFVKTIDRQSDSGGDGTSRSEVTTEDKIFIPTAKEFINRNITDTEVTTTGYRNFYALAIGTQYEAYKTANVRSKTMVTSSTFSLTFSYETRQPIYGWQCVTTGNSGTYVTSNVASGFMPHFCI